MRWRRVLCAAVVALRCWGVAWAQESGVDHSAWDALLGRYVHDGLVDYDGLQRERSALDRYLADLGALNVRELREDPARKALWLNAYNACVVKGVLDHAPLTSVKELKGFFGRDRYRIGRHDMTLSDMELEARALNDPRIHFALARASVGSPPLRAEAYAPERLDAQLAEQARQFLADARHGLRLEPGRMLWVSKLFRSYGPDFIGEHSALSAAALLPAIQPYLAPQTAQAIAASLEDDLQLPLAFFDEDWTLNELR